MSNKYHKVSNLVQCSNIPNTCDCGGGMDKLVSNKYHKVSNWVQCSTRLNTCDCGGVWINLCQINTIRCLIGYNVASGLTHVTVGG